MIDLYAIGREAIHLFWGPVIVWTGCAMLWMLLVRVVAPLAVAIVFVTSLA